MVRLESISKSFGDKTVIDDVTVDIESGERFTLLGKSGCGKTTLLRLIAGFETPDRGRIVIDGQDVTALPVERRPVGFIFQNYALFPHMTVFDNIAVGPRIRHVPEAETAQRIDELLEMTRLTELRDAYPGRLSGGEAQRVAIARAIVNQPKMLLLDEPLSALDASLRGALREELVEMQKTLGVTFLFVTHDQEEAMGLATRMGILEGGRLLQVGTPPDLYDHPQTPFVTEFLGEVNGFSGIVVGQTGRRVEVEISGKERLVCESDSEHAPGKRVICFVRPEKIGFLNGQERDPANNYFRGTVTGETFFGRNVLYKIMRDNGETITLCLSRGESDKEAVYCPKGSEVVVRFSTGDVILFEDDPLGAGRV